MSVMLVVSAAVAAVGSDSPVTGTFRLQHQTASQAVDLIYPHLSEAGTVELRPGDNTLVIRDLPERVERILALLAEAEVRTAPLRFEIKIVRASLGPPDDGPRIEGGLEPSLEQRLRELLHYERFELLSGRDLSVSEGQPLEAWIGSEFLVRFRVGALQPDRRLKLDGFQVARRRQGDEPEVLVHTNLSLWLDKPMILGLARTESSDHALMVVIHGTAERTR
jgi:hypothetical protein